MICSHWHSADEALPFHVLLFAGQRSVQNFCRKSSSVFSRQRSATGSEHFLPIKEERCCARLKYAQFLQTPGCENPCWPQENRAKQPTRQRKVLDLPKTLHGHNFHILCFFKKRKSSTVTKVTFFKKSTKPSTSISNSRLFLKKWKPTFRLILLLQWFPTCRLTHSRGH